MAGNQQSSNERQGERARRERQREREQRRAQRLAEGHGAEMPGVPNGAVPDRPEHTGRQASVGGID